MSTLTAGRQGAPAIIRRPAQALAQVAGTLALTGSVAASVLLAAAAAERPSLLSPPSRVAFPGWLAGPLAGLLPHLTSSPLRLEWLFTIGLAVLGAAWLGAWAFARTLPATWTIVAVGGAHLAFLLGPPQQLTDIFNYVQYGRMPALHALNPYVVAPLANAADPVFRWTNWSHLPSPYGPLFTLLSEALAPLGVAGAYWVLKVVITGASLGVVALVWTGVRRAGRNPAPAAALAGLNPLVLAYGVGGVHNDALVMLAATAALVLAARPATAAPARPAHALAAGATAVAGAAMKASAAVFVPVLVLGARRRRDWAALGAAAAALAIVGLTIALYGGALPSIGLQSRLVSPISGPNIAGALLGHGGATAGVRAGAEALLALAVAAACVAVLLGTATATAAGWTAVAAVLTLTWSMPWYVGWVLPFAALSRSRALRLVVVLLTAWLALAWFPRMPELIHHYGLKPTRTPVGQAAHARIEQLLH